MTIALTNLLMLHEQPDLFPPAEAIGNSKEVCSLAFNSQFIEDIEERRRSKRI
jgi:hypothetical protein